MLFGSPAFVTLILQLHIPVIHPGKVTKTCQLILSSCLRKETKKIALENCYLLSHSSGHLQRAVQHKDAFTQEHCRRQPFLQPQRTSSWQELITSGSAVQ